MPYLRLNAMKVVVFFIFYFLADVVVPIKPLEILPVLKCKMMGSSF